MNILLPADEAALAADIARAHAAREPLSIEGRGTKRAMLRPVQAARTLSTRMLTGITLYKPSELVMSARAGTPIAEIEAALAEKGQQIIAEPPDLSALFGAAEGATLGGVVATNLSGPRRIAWGAMRDHVLGIRAVKGDGEIFRSGGRVLKNVTGLDLCKLLAGSHGTLGVLTEITFKVLPRPEESATLAVGVPDIATGIRVLSAGLGSPYGVSGAAILLDGPGITALLRLEDFSESVTYRMARLREDLAPLGRSLRLETGQGLATWQAVRDATALGAAPDEAVWRLSLPPSAAPAACAALAGFRLLLDWGGGLVWVAGPATEAAHATVMSAAAAGSFTLFRAPDGLRGAVPVVPAEPAALATIGARVKAVMDPGGILNPGRIRPGG
jgi:glycolate oxidase FAD binding subunit